MYTTITRARFEELNADLFKATLGPVETALRDAGIGECKRGLAGSRLTADGRQAHCPLPQPSLLRQQPDILFLISTKFPLNPWSFVGLAPFTRL